jgi:predicted RecB family nuclease
MIITQEIFEAFLHCCTKAHLISRPDVVDATSGQVRRPGQEFFQQSASSWLRASFSDGDVCTGTPAAEAIKRQRYRLILDCTVLTTGLRAQLHGLELVRLSDRSVRRYVPIRFLSAERISTADRLLLAFDALVFSQATRSTLPHIGKIIHGRGYVTTTVLIAPLCAKVQSVVAAITTQQIPLTPPALVLNKHCGECQYSAQCREVATKVDDLSLLGKMSEKERQRYHEKGIFTVTQLSYTFRPRHRRRAGDQRKHEHALQALAIRKNQVHVVGTLTFATVGTPVYFDVEGDPDRDFYYCIGLRFETDGVIVQRAYWADSPSDEGKMWADCLYALATIDAPQLVHYGSYDGTFLRQMKQRYPDPERAALHDRIIASAVNLISTIYARVYFPTYSNSLKDLAQYLGFRWSEPMPSGRTALSWRREWERSRAPELKQKLITYNAEDCAAAQVVSEALSALSPSSSPNNADVVGAVDVTTLRREYPQRLGKAEFVLREFQQINNAAHWDYQREKVYARSNKNLARLQRKTLSTRWAVPINKLVECEEQRPTYCTDCGAKLIWVRLL